jgi:hypothetical protein
MAVAILLAAFLGTATNAMAEPPFRAIPLPADAFATIDLSPVTLDQPQVGDAAPAVPSTPLEIADFGSELPLGADDAADRFAQPDTATRDAPVKAESKRPRINHRVRGQATWYCKSGVSSCHYAHSGGMYAAAGAEIRKGDWRGRQVQVCQGGRCIWVTLIDWCACAGSRIIDLYSDAYRKLDPLSGGVITVTVGW